MLKNRTFRLHFSLPSEALTFDKGMEYEQLNYKESRFAEHGRSGS